MQHTQNEVDDMCGKQSEILTKNKWTWKTHSSGIPNQKLITSILGFGSKLNQVISSTHSFEVMYSEGSFTHTYMRMHTHTHKLDCNCVWTILQTVLCCANWHTEEWTSTVGRLWSKMCCVVLSHTYTKWTATVSGPYSKMCCAKLHTHEWTATLHRTCSKMHHVALSHIHE